MIATNSLPIKVSNDLIHSYYYNEFNQKKRYNSGVVVDDACYELMFVKEKNVNLINGHQEAFSLPPCFTLNNLKSPFRFEFSETFSIFCIKLQPWMNSCYVPTKKSQLLNLNELYARPITELHQRIFSSSCIKEMVVHAEDFLLSLEIEINKETEFVKNICELIYAKSGNITINEIAVRFNLYRQKLNQIFKRHVKYTLKNFINCIRIRACLGYKLDNPKVSLTEIGYLYGYYDQAHFIHSFKNACGVTPSEYVKVRGYSFTSAIASE